MGMQSKWLDVFLREEEPKDENYVFPETNGEGLSPKKAKKREKIIDRVNRVPKVNLTISYRVLRIIAWIAMLFSALAVVLSAASVAIEGRSETAIGPIMILSSIFRLLSALALPCFLLANFASIIQQKNNMFRSLALYAGLSVLIYGIFALVYFHYAIGIGLAIFNDFEATQMVLSTIIKLMFGGFLSFNVFIDLFFFSLTFFFLFYTPQKGFFSKHIVLFRIFFLFPILFEIACFVLKGLDAVSVIDLPLYLFPLLPSKPPLTSLAFTLILIFLKIREKKFFSYGFSKKDLMFYEDSKYGRTRFNHQVIVLFVVFGLLDAIIYFILANSPASELINIGFGNSMALLIVIPLVVFFSYTKRERSMLPDIIIPVVGVALLVFAYVEGYYQLFINNIAGFFDKIFGSGGKESSASALLISLIQSFLP